MKSNCGQMSNWLSGLKKKRKMRLTVMDQAPSDIEAQTQQVSHIVNVVINYDTVSHDAAS